MLLIKLIRKIINLNKYRNKKSIIEITETGEQRWCNLKDANDIYGWHKGYKLIKRYVDKDEWNVLKPFDKEFIIQCKRNCDNCIHDRKECDPDKNVICNDMKTFEKFNSK